MRILNKLDNLRKILKIVRTLKKTSYFKKGIKIIINRKLNYNIEYKLT